MGGLLDFLYIRSVLQRFHSRPCPRSQCQTRLYTCSSISTYLTMAKVRTAAEVLPLVW